MIELFYCIFKRNLNDRGKYINFLYEILKGIKFYLIFSYVFEGS